MRKLVCVRGYIFSFSATFHGISIYFTDKLCSLLGAMLCGPKFCLPVWLPLTKAEFMILGKGVRAIGRALESGY